MEKFGLFDLLEKFNAGTQSKPPQNKTENAGVLSGGAADISGTPPQLKMNDKFKDFVARHDAAAAAILAAADAEKRKTKPKNKPAVKADMKKTAKTKKSQVGKKPNANSENAVLKKRGRPKKYLVAAKAETDAEKPVAKKRGRPKKTTV